VCLLVAALIISCYADSEARAPAMPPIYLFNCTSDRDCVGIKSFCSKPFCLSMFGSCVLKPAACGRIYDPVCGCDGKTYSSACTANSQGTNVDYKGQCAAVGGCSQNSDCKMGYFCRKAAKQCSASGTCDMIPRFCTKEYAPVCGCNGLSFGNKCMAASNATNVASDGSCNNSPIPKQSGCSSDSVHLSLSVQCDVW